MRVRLDSDSGENGSTVLSKLVALVKLRNFLKSMSFASSSSFLLVQKDLDD
jgi:hypothetical protein